MQVFTNGTILLDADRTTHALGVEDAVVKLVGDDALNIDPASVTERVDLEGGVLIPGVGDGHCHPLFGAYEQLGPNIGEATSIEQVQDAVRKWVAAHPDAEWVLGGSYDITLAQDAEFEARWLDAVTDKPTVLRAFDHHTVWVNSAALRAAGIDKNTPDPALGRIVRYDDGTPKGTLQEAAANNLLDHVVPPRSLDERVWAIEQATLTYAQQGTTWIQDAWVEPGDVDAYVEAARKGRIHTRVNLALRADPNRWSEQVDEFIAAKQRIDACGHPLLTAQTVKFFMDGVIETRTALLEEPYLDRHSADNSSTGNRGIGNWSVDELAQATTAMSNAGFQLHLHAIGDRANRLALDALEALEPEVRRMFPPVVAHVALIHPEQQKRFAELSVIANFEPYWAQLDPVMEEMTLPQLGAQREKWQYPIGTVMRSGATVTFGSDWPVSTRDWRPGVDVAVARAEHNGQPWLPEERICPADALRAYTANIAKQALAEARGTLDPGMDADFVWLDGNPLHNSASSLTVKGTWVGGRQAAAE
jgi:predicted amidohydrolase YtcJ